MLNMLFMRLPDKFLARFAAFSITGIVNTLVGVAVILLAGLAGAGPVLANIIGYTIGLVLSFALNSRITFRSRSSDKYTAIRFLGAFLVAFCANIAVVLLSIDVLHFSNRLGSLAGTPLYMVLFFLMCERWVFRKTGRTV